MSMRFPLTLAAVAALLTLAMPAQAEDGVAAIVNGDKIGTQINMGENGTYIEKNINNIEQIKVAISDWWDKKNEQELFLLVVCENRSRVAQISGLSSILDYYGEDYGDYGDEEDHVY